MLKRIYGNEKKIIINNTNDKNVWPFSPSSYLILNLISLNIFKAFENQFQQEYLVVEST